MKHIKENGENAACGKEQKRKREEEIVFSSSSSSLANGKGGWGEGTSWIALGGVGGGKKCNKNVAAALRFPTYKTSGREINLFIPSPKRKARCGRFMA